VTGVLPEVEKAIFVIVTDADYWDHARASFFDMVQQTS
jgi:hypothetical protein